MDTNELKQKLIHFGTNFKDSAGKVTKNAMDGSKKMAEKIRIQSNISKAEKNLTQTYVKIGQKYEELYGNRSDPDFSVYMMEIADIRAQIAAARAELASLDTAVLCKNCGKYVTENQNFCPNCGSKIMRDAPVEAEVVPSEPSEPENIPEKQEYEEY